MKKQALKRAFIMTLPILTGFLFLGMVYGIYTTSYGFNAFYPLLMAAFIFAGSMEFLTVPLLIGTFNPLSAFLLTLMVNSRHMFYGIAMLDKYNKVRNWKRWYMIFGMCDESFAINYTMKCPANIDAEWLMFFVTLLNHIYWIVGAGLGGFIGNRYDITIPGLSFVMTALFVVIFLEQCLQERNWQSAAAGILLSLIALNLCGAQYFVPLALLLILIFLVIRKRLHDNKHKEALA